jgi:pimeloyl-ACP methyl ester carboxylesterase
MRSLFAAPHRQPVRLLLLLLACAASALHAADRVQAAQTATRTEAKPAQKTDAKPEPKTDAKPEPKADAKQAKPGEPKATEQKPGEPKSAEGRQNEPKNEKGETKSGDTKSGEGKTQDIRPGDIRQELKPNNKPGRGQEVVPPEEPRAVDEDDLHPEIVHKATGTVQVGMLGAAAYRIDIPANWNHSLVVFYHGYNERRTLFHATNGLNDVTGPIFRLGFAIAQSGYSTTGWSLEHAPGETEKLRRYFVRHYGQPADTYIVGVSMGGALTLMTVETNPKPYRGALDLCGAVGPAIESFDRRFAWRAAFDYYFPGLMPPLVSASGIYAPPVPEDEVRRLHILAVLKQHPEAAAAMRALTHMRADADLARLMNYITYVLADMQHKAGGNPFDNRNYLYTGTNPLNTSSTGDIQLNDGVRRYASDAHALPYLAQHYTPTGRITRPVLAVHTLFDPLVPATTLALYEHQVEAAGYGHNLVQRYVHHEGHCVFTRDEVQHAMDDLVAWTHGGHRPEAGFQR